MSSDTVVRARIDSETKARATEALQVMGLSVSDAIRLLAACFFLSGFAALLYQAAWLKKLGVVFGTSHVDVEQALARVIELGGGKMNEPVTNELGITCVYCRDPFGNLLELVKPVGGFPTIQNTPG